MSEHINHCNAGSWVYLLSLGCTANFIVKGPSMDTCCKFKFCSSDVLVFNASTNAGILHGVNAIVPDFFPTKLIDFFSPTMLQCHRFGIQCRVKEKALRN